MSKNTHIRHAHSTHSGTHIFGELSGLEFSLLNNAKLLERYLLESIPAGGATICGHLSKCFSPQGVTSLVLLSESHAAIHTYPEIGCLFFDIFTCGDCKPDLILDSLIEKLKPGKSNRSSIVRTLQPTDKIQL